MALGPLNDGHNGPSNTEAIRRQKKNMIKVAQAGFNKPIWFEAEFLYGLCLQIWIRLNFWIQWSTRSKMCDPRCVSIIHVVST